MHPHLAALLARPIAHRGLHSCGRALPVENSLGAARAAIAAGCGIECDVQLSADGEAMVFHDAGLERLTGAPGALCERTAAELGTVRLGGSADCIPTLGTFLAAIGGAVPVVVEIKSRYDGDLRLAGRVTDLVRAYDGPVALESFDPDVVRYLLDEAKTPSGLVGPAEHGATDTALLPRCAFASWSIGALDEFVAHYPELPRSSWTIRTAEQLANARRLGAQVVFEGIEPFALANP